jgi:hypothetical protein
MKEITKDKALIGAAGVHHVVSELSLRGLIALPTIRNTQGIDIAVVHPDGKWHASIQVKTSRSKVGFWPIGMTYNERCGPTNYYVFVRYLADQRRLEAFLKPSEQVVAVTDARVAADRARGVKDWSPCWHLPTEPSELERVRRQWLAFGTDDA